jgi:hypothetical protein
VSPEKYELGFYIPEGGFHHRYRRENLNFYTCVIKFEVSLSEFLLRDKCGPSEG